MLIAVAFSFNAAANSNSEISISNNVESLSNVESQSAIFRILDPCLPAWMNTYQANVGTYGHEMAVAMAHAAWNACHDMLNPDPK